MKSQCFLFVHVMFCIIGTQLASCGIYTYQSKVAKDRVSGSMAVFWPDPDLKHWVTLCLAPGFGISKKDEERALAKEIGLTLKDSKKKRANTLELCEFYCACGSEKVL